MSRPTLLIIAGMGAMAGALLTHLLPALAAVVCLALPLWGLWVVIIEGPDRPPGVDHRSNWRKWQEEAEIARAANGIRSVERGRKR